MPGGTFFMSVLIEAEINEVLAWENVEVVVHMLKISCGSSVVSSYYTTFLLVKKPGIKFQNRNLQFVFLMGFFPLM